MRLTYYSYMHTYVYVHTYHYVPKYKDLLYEQLIQNSAYISGHSGTTGTFVTPGWKISTEHVAGCRYVESRETEELRHMQPCNSHLPPLCPLLIPLLVYLRVSSSALSIHTHTRTKCELQNVPSKMGVPMV